MSVLKVALLFDFIIIIISCDLKFSHRAQRLFLALGALVRPGVVF